MKKPLPHPSGNSPSIGVASLLDEAWRLEPFAPPFAFGAFFSPEDTLLCACAANAARELLSGPATTDDRAASRFRFAELTSGSGLVGFHLLGHDSEARLRGLDIDGEATLVAERNARLLGLGDRARFARADLWSASTLVLLQAEKPQLLVCNPPYVPEPPGTRMQVEAGAGPHGTAHLLRALELTRLVQPETLALSWCSLSDPAGIVAAAEGSGYQLRTLYVAAIAEGEYSGSVHSYLRDLGDCFINEQAETLDIVAPDGSARFAYLLMAGAFERGGSGNVAPLVEKICQDFARDGVRSLASATAPFTLRCSTLNRWDELRLRVMLHGEVVHTPKKPG
ncbi:MAG: hypothetical protein M3P12_15430 [Gemmatimonadota bacterium]|nr:hypothetical protein [Gemmatimonadota bacterium]